MTTMNPSRAAPSEHGRGHACGAVARAAGQILAQCEEFVARVPSAMFTAPSVRMPGGTMGKHVRHLLDHFAAAFSSLDGAIIDYDHRRREGPVETDPLSAGREAARLRVLASGLSDADLARRVTIRVMVFADGHCEDLESTLARELAFATHHAVHHHAMIKTIAAEMGHPTDADFGKAPSTVSHESTTRGTVGRDGHPN